MAGKLIIPDDLKGVTFGSSEQKQGLVIPDDLKGVFFEPREPERTLLGIGEEGGGTLGDLGVTAIKGAIGLPQGLVGVGSALTGGRVGKAVEDAGIRFDESQKMLDGMYSPAQQAANTSVRNADGFMNTLEAVKDNPSTVVTTVGESLPSVLGGGVIAKGVGLIPKVAPWVAGAVGEGVMGAGSAAEQIREQTADGLLTTKQQLAAGGTGVGTALFGGVGGKLARKFGAGDIDSAMAGAVSNEAQRGFAARLTAAGISEGVFEELPQSVQEQMWRNFAMDKPLDDGVGNAAAMGLVAGTTMGAGFESGRSLGNRAVNPNDGGTQQEADWGDQNEAPPAEAPPAPMQEQPEAAPQEQQPAALGHNPERMITMPDGTTAWESELAGLQQDAVAKQNDAIARQHPAYPSELAKTADDLEAELGQGQSVDDQIAALEAELASPIDFAAPAIPKKAAPMGAQTSAPIGNEIDYSPVGIEPEGLSLVPKEAQAAPDYRMIDPPASNSDSQSSPLDTLAQGVEAEIGKHIDKKRAARLPDGLKDNRLLRDHYRGALEGMTNDLSEGGGISYLRDENDRITGRTKSTNPSWFQSLNTDPSSSMSVKNVRKALANALAGKKLFPRQARVIKSMLDEHQFYREDYAKQKRLTRQEVQNTRRAALDELHSLSPEHADLIQRYGDYEEAKNAGLLYNEPDYHAGLTHHERANAELAEQAWALGASYDDIDSAAESGHDAAETTKALHSLIFGLRNEHRQRQADDRGGNRRGSENDVLAPESSGPVNQGGPEENNAPAGRMDQESPDAAQSASGQVEPFALDQQTEESAKAEADRLEAAAKAEADQNTKAEQKAKADSDAKDFKLTGSDSPSDVAASHGQNDLFAGGGKAIEPDKPEQPTEPTKPQPSAGVSVSGDTENKQGGISPADSARNDAILRFVPPSIIKGFKVDAPVFDENTGETHTEKVPAQEALDAVNADIETYKSLLACVRGG
jgi:hypothetical protein